MDEKIVKDSQCLVNELVNGCISRKAAIEAICKSECGIGFCGVPCPEVCALKALPSAQPEVAKDTNVLTNDCISRHAAIDALDKRFDSIPMEQTTEILQLRKDLREMPSAQPETHDKRAEMHACDLISRAEAIDAQNSLINRFEQILRDIRETKVDDSVCGMCEYDGAYIGQSGDWCNECPGFEKDDCFKLSEVCRKRWLESVELPSAQPEEASMILGASKDGVRLWYQCSVCGEPVDADDNYCCNCGRKFING